MNAYVLPLSCPRCGGEMLPGESVELAPDHVQATTRCGHCMDLYRIDVVATVVEPWPVDLCDPRVVEQRRREQAAYAVSPLEGMNR